MSTMTATTVTASVHRSGWDRARRIGLGAVRVILAAQFVAGGALKLTADPAMVAMFNDIGAGDWLRLLVGVCEVGGFVVGGSVVGDFVVGDFVVDDDASVGDGDGET